ERFGPTVVDDELFGRPDDLERARLALTRGVSPGRDPMTAEDRADRRGLVAPDRGDVETQLEPGAAPVDPGHSIPEAAAGQALAVGRGREGDPGIGVE